MPIPQTTRSSIGPSVARNTYGNAPRTLGGVFQAPTSYDSFGTDPAATGTFLPGTTKTLSTVNFPGYSLTQGMVVQISYSGVIQFNGVGNASGTIKLLVNPKSGGGFYSFTLGVFVPPGGAANHVFAGQVDLLVQGASSDASSVAITSVFFPPATTPSAPELTLPQGSSIGILSLDTTGLLAGINFSLQAIMDVPPATPSIAKIQLNRFVTEIAGG